MSANGTFVRRSPEDAAIGERQPGLLPYALCLLFGLPLLFGLVSLSSGLKLSNGASRFVRDVAAMYRQGVDFGKPEGQRIVFDLAHARGLPIAPENTVVILSTIRKVSDADCDSSGSGTACVNRGLPVIQRQVVLGNARLHTSRFGSAPAEVTPRWVQDRAARVPDFGTNLRPGETVWAAETWFATTDQPGGIYVRGID